MIRPNASTTLGVSPWTLALIGVVMVVRVLELALLDAFTLTEDEAHYWLWAQHLDWSYATKGPGVALLIAASTAILGDNEFAVRLPAVLCSGLTALVVARLSRATVPLAGSGFIGAMLFLSLPGAQLTGMLMTIDAPYLLCWALAALAAWHAVVRGVGAAWIWFGLALAAGVLFKYTILLLIPGVAVFGLLRMRDLPKPSVRWVALGLLAMCVGFAPVAVWNSQHDWATVRHLLGHLGLPGGDVAVSGDGWSYNALWTLEYLALTLAIGGATGVLAIQAMLNGQRASSAVPAPPGGAGVFLVACAAPIAVFYLAVTALTKVEANWNLAGFVTLCPLAAWGVLEARHRADAGVMIAYRAAQALLALGLLAVPVLAIAASSGERVLGIPTNRVGGARDLAEQTEAQMRALRETTGLDPFVMTTHYGRASLLSFYLDGRPTVYAAGHVLESGRTTQFDLWPNTDLSRRAVNDQLRGRPAVLFGGENTDWTGVFADVEPIGPLPAEPKTTRSTSLGFGFRGFTPQENSP